MALEVQVYKDVRAYEAKVMFGMSWRQLGAAAVAVVIGGGSYAAMAIAMHANGASWDNATNIALYVLFPILIPIVAWGWWRPKGLKPEQYIGYVINHYASRKVITYADEYRGLDAGRPADQRDAREQRKDKKKEKENLKER
ncbi:PrgI family protein [Bifidobacterium aquikefiricola]|uniref:PrgI family protein n=1 Tax=Bifidobacterium aquikefiricola TaxID=3059038 RepID=A0AB39U6P2_9BIFI